MFNLNYNFIYFFKRGSTLFKSTALVATIIDEADINKADISGRSDHPSEL